MNDDRYSLREETEAMQKALATGVSVTGILVRAQRPDGSWGAEDIARLDRASLHRWLRSRGGRNLWAENVVLTLLGHEPIGENES